MSAAARIYPGRVMHRRLFPVAYRFEYPVFTLLLDVDRVAEAARAVPFFSHNRRNLLSFHDRDHGPRDGSPLRPWLEAHLARAGVELEGGRVSLLAFPRLLGYVFNPLSLWFCHHRDGTLRAVLCEVSNTFGERHSYLLHEHGAPLETPVRQGRDKHFHVSPFLSMDARYEFRISPPGERLAVAIREFQDDALTLVATQTGEARPWSSRELLRALARMPLVGLQVMARIHRQALGIWLRGAPFHRKPAPPAEELTP